MGLWNGRCDCDCDNGGDEKRSAAGELRTTWTWDELCGFRGVKICVGWVVIGAGEKCAERTPFTGRVGCVTNGAVSSSSLSDRGIGAMGSWTGDDDVIGSRRYMLKSFYISLEVLLSIQLL
jgi:hypothetical protein